MKHKIKAVEEGSIAWQLGIRSGDALISINGEEVIDFIDYQALSSEENMVLTVESAGEITDYSFQKDGYEPLGMEFFGDMLGKTRDCVNHCRFCFVDQLPPNARPTMKEKDDDWRLSLMMGNFITLTNVSDAELDRIIRRRASPLYISVHATDNRVRNDLMRPLTKCDIMERLRRLREGGISFHAQAVVCPGINDGPVLKQTIDDLLSLYPACLSFAVVPVGLTRFRSGLDDLKMFDRASAKALLDLVNPIRAFCKGHFGSNFVFPSDEMYILAGEELPEDSEYEDYCQIDNGVGLCRSLITEFEYAYEDMPPKYKRAKAGGRKLLAACGVSFKPILERLLDEHPVSGVDIRVKAIINDFFGDTVTVSGLITGGDLIRQLENEDCEAVLITQTMLRQEDMRFLDDMLLSEAEEKLGKPIIPVGRTGEELLETLKAFSDV